uniref:Uncharacterized protein n=1 Tax=Prolemur simus TaxID=1328070 RepID=A0A8C8Z0E8_PROSS
MEEQKEAEHILTLSVWKMHHSRMQRGGLRLHRSLQLSLVPRSAWELYLPAKVEAHEPGVLEARPLPCPSPAPAAGSGTALPEPVDTQEAPRAEKAPARGGPRAAKVSRKRRAPSPACPASRTGASPASGAAAPRPARAPERRPEARGALPDTPTCARPPPPPTVLSRYLSRLSRGLAWHWEAVPGGGGGVPLVALGSGCGGGAFSFAHGRPLRLEASQVKSSPAYVRAAWEPGGPGREGAPVSASCAVATGQHRAAVARTSPQPCLGPPP